MKIMLSLKRGAIFHKIAVFKKLSNILQKNSQKGSQNHEKSIKKQSIKLFKKTTLNKHVFDQKRLPKWRPGAIMSMLPVPGFGTPGPPKAPNTSKDDPGTPKY